MVLQIAIEAYVKGEPRGEHRQHLNPGSARSGAGGR